MASACRRTSAASPSAPRSRTGRTCRCERSGHGAAGAAGQSRAGADRHTAVPTNGDTPGALGDTWHGLVNGIVVMPKTPLFDTATLTSELTWMHLDERHAERSRVQGPRTATCGDRQGPRRTSGPRGQLHADLVPGAAGRRPTMRRSPGPGHQRQRGDAVRRQQGTGNWSVGLGADDLSEVPRRSLVHRLFRQLLDDRGERRRDRHPRHQRRAVRPRLGLAHVQDHILRRSTIMFRKSLMALAVASLTAGSAWAAVSADEAKQLGTTLTPVGAEKAGNKDGTIPEYTGGIKPPAGLQGGQRHPPRSVRQRKAAPRHHRQGHGGARGQADRGHEGAAEALSDDARRRLSDAPDGRVPAALIDNTLKNATGAKTVEGGLGIENALPGYPFPIPKTGYEAMWNHLLPTAAWATTAQVRQLERRLGGHADAGDDRRGVLRVAGVRPEEDRRAQGDRSVLVRQAHLPRARAPQRRGADGLGLGQSAEAAAPRVAVPAGPAPGQARAGHRLRHAESRLRGRVDVRRRVACSTARWTASTSSSSARRRCTFPYNNYRLT